MSATVSHQGVPSDPEQLNFRYTRNPNGWVTAQIVEYPAAISEGATEHEAYLNVLEALHDLTHEPTAAERIALTAQARLQDLVEQFEELAGRVREGAAGALRDLGRDRVRG